MYSTNLNKTLKPSDIFRSRFWQPQQRPIWQVRYIQLHVIVMKFVFKSKHLYMLILRTNSQCYMQMLQVLRTSVKCLLFAGVTGYWLFAGIIGYWQVLSIIV
jgi:hypothetical protein